MVACTTTIPTSWTSTHLANSTVTNNDTWPVSSLLPALCSLPLLLLPARQLDIMSVNILHHAPKEANPSDSYSPAHRLLLSPLPLLVIHSPLAPPNRPLDLDSDSDSDHDQGATHT